jgi:hypothetical protein
LAKELDMQKESFGPRSVTKSKFNRFLWVFCVGWVLVSVFLCCLFPWGKFAGKERLGLLTSGVIPGLVVWSKAWEVLIDSNARTITFRKLVSNKEVVYSFDELDGFVHVYVPQKHGDKVKVVYLVKDRKFCEKLSGSLYSNLDELEGALASLKFLGVQKLNLAKIIAIFRKRPVL